MKGCFILITLFFLPRSQSFSLNLKQIGTVILTQFVSNFMNFIFMPNKKSIVIVMYLKISLYHYCLDSGRHTTDN
jgi:hypothetical protein